MRSILTAVLTLTAALALVGSPPRAQSAEPVLPSVEWQASAQTVAGRVIDLVEYAKAFGTDDAILADAVGGLKDKVAAKKAAPAWVKKTSWIEGEGANQVFFGVGAFSGATSNRQLALSVAENRARVEVAKLLKVKIERRSEANGWRSVTTTSTALLANVVIVDWYAQGTTVYALAAYAKPLAIEADAPWIP